MNASLWPDGATCAAFFSFDLDGESWLLGQDDRNAHLPVTLSQAAYGPKVGVFEILKLLTEFSVKATFFVPGWVAEHHPKAVDAIVDRGHSVGLHGYLHECPAYLSKEQEIEILGRSIEILESRTGVRPIGYRAPDAEVSEYTIPLLAQMGVQYSSSFMDDVFPYFHAPANEPGVLANEPGVVELPIHWSLDDWQFSMVSPHARPAPELNPIMTNDHIFSIWANEFDAISALGGLFVLLNHPQVTGRPGRIGVLRRLLAHVTEREGTWIANGELISDYWRKSRPHVPRTGH